MPDLLLFHDVVLVQAVREHLADLTEVARHEVFRLTVLVEEAVEGGLEREAVHHVELPPDDHARRLLLRSLHAEFAREEAEHLVLFRHQLWQHPHPQVASIVDRELRSIHEHILLTTMTVHVNVRQYLILVLALQVGLDISKKLLHSAYDRVQFGVR